jgi:hypothetical protein
MKKRTSATAILTAGALLISTNVVPANAYWAWEPTWKFPTTARHVYVWDPAWTSAEIPVLDSGATRWSGLPGSNLNVAGVIVTNDSSVYAAARYKLQKISAATWPMDAATPAFACRIISNCFAYLPAVNLSNEAIVKFNMGWTFVAAWNRPAQVADLETVLVHELGHGHGLGHPWENPDGHTTTSGELASVMNVTWSTKRVPKADDVAGIASIYPAN